MKSIDRIVSVLSQRKHMSVAEISTETGLAESTIRLHIVNVPGINKLTHGLYSIKGALMAKARDAKAQKAKKAKELPEVRYTNTPCSPMVCSGCRQMVVITPCVLCRISGRTGMTYHSK